MIGRFHPVTILCILRIENNKFKVPAAFERAGAICLVRQEVPERSEQKRSKLAFQWIGPLECSVFQQMQKEPLGKILRVVRCVSAAPSKSV